MEQYRKKLHESCERNDDEEMEEDQINNTRWMEGNGTVQESKKNHHLLLLPFHLLKTLIQYQVHNQRTY